MKSALKPSFWLIPVMAISLLGCGTQTQDNNHPGQSGPAPNGTAASQSAQGPQNDATDPNDANNQDGIDFMEIPTDPQSLKVLSSFASDIQQGVDYVIQFKNGDIWHITSMEIVPDTLHRQDGRNQLVGAKVECCSDNGERVTLSPKEFNLVISGLDKSNYILGGLILERNGKAEEYGFAERDYAFSQQSTPTSKHEEPEVKEPTPPRHESSPQAPKQALPDGVVPPPAPAPKPAN